VHHRATGGALFQKRNCFRTSTPIPVLRFGAGQTSIRLEPAKQLGLYPSVMNPHHALMIVDVQAGFEPPPQFVKKLRRYSRYFSCRIFTRYVNPPESMFRKVLKQKSCAPGSPDTILLLSPEPGDLVIEKASYGLKPRDITQLRRRKIRQITVCGLDTDACVLGVMFSLFDAGIICHLKENMCWSSSGLHKAAVQITRAQFPETH
jgi:nicotinamidase-related amidase